MSRIGILGGTFNPPHVGHRYLALEIKKKAALDKIIIIPAYVPPHKQAHDLKSGSDRLEMCRRTFTDGFFEVSDCEIKRGGKSYTFDTLKELKKKYPNDELFLIIGSDMLLSFNRWYRWQDIALLARLCVISRESDVDFEALRSFAFETLGLDFADGGIIIADVPATEISSTKIRETVKSGGDISGMVTDGVYEYIKEMRFYR